MMAMDLVGGRHRASGFPVRPACSHLSSTSEVAWGSSREHLLRGWSFRAGELEPPDLEPIQMNTLFPLHGL